MVLGVERADADGMVDGVGAAAVWPDVFAAGGVMLGDEGTAKNG